MDLPQRLSSPTTPVLRWLRFSVVGLAGIVVQVTTLVILADRLAVNLQIATLTAVMAAILHNFVWHLRWTWADRQGASVPAMFVRFTAANGFVSLAGNTVIVSLLVDAVGVPTATASLLSIAACGLLNYVLADRLVFALPDRCQP